MKKQTTDIKVLKFKNTSDHHLKKAIGELEEVLIIGYYNDTNDEIYVESNMRNGKALWALEHAKVRLLAGSGIYYEELNDD